VRGLESATWAVVQRRGRVLGIAAAKLPKEVEDSYASRTHARFIESVWVDPGMRGQGVGERLVTYLIERQRQAGIQDFYLWVFDNNEPAIGLYKRMEFKPTGRPSDLVDRHEIQYLRAFDSNLIDKEELKRNAEARRRDRRDFEVTYRLLSAKPAWGHLPLLERLLG
jgi:L-amino acid N-acyltransferase YncA